MNEIINTKIFELINNKTENTISKNIFFSARMFFFGIDCAEKLQQEAILHVVAKHLYNQDLGRKPAYPFRGKKLTDPLVSTALDEMAATASNNKDLIQCINPSSLSEELNPLQLLDIFKKVSKHTTNPFAIQLFQSIFSPILRCWE
jgi:hypothetical protein